MFYCLGAVYHGSGKKSTRKTGEGAGRFPGPSWTTHGRPLSTAKWLLLLLSAAVLAAGLLFALGFRRRGR